MIKTVDITQTLRLKAAPISYSVIAAFARGVVLWHDRNVFVENGGHLSFVLHRAKTEKTWTEYRSLYFEKVICIFDIFKRQKTDKLSFRKYNIVSVYVPANMTNHFQRLDLTVNGVAKTFLKVKFRNWYANEVTKQLAELKSNQLKISYK